MTIDTELDAMGKVLSALQPLEPEVQTRVLKWAADKLGLNGVGIASRNPLPAQAETRAPAGRSAVEAWLSQNGLDETALEQVFHVSGADTSLAAARVPGASGRERTLNCYILMGITTLLRSGETVFSDKEARDLCMTMGCFDSNHHSAFLASKGNEFVGSKEKGWTLTAPGRRRAADLIKQIIADN